MPQGKDSSDVKRTGEPDPSHVSSDEGRPHVSRRELVQLGGAVAVAAAVPIAMNDTPSAAAAALQSDAEATPMVAEADALPPAIPPWMKE